MTTTLESRLQFETHDTIKRRINERRAALRGKK